ncbi:MAG TPA: phosphatase PAP2 family protein [Candidatus Dormibacteraeota bacterium]|nr:phosphatase PAP2 family protein [Candidatus Dormibacteraeota bacterium]
MATAERVAEDVASGDVGRASRRWLGWLAAVLATAFAVNTYFVATTRLLPFDLPVALFVQRVPWGPLTAVMGLTNFLGAGWQPLLGALAVVLLALIDRRAGWLMALGSLASILDDTIKLLFSRQRPAPDLVHVLAPVSGYSYPSGHAVFFTWLSFMLAFSLAPMLRPRLRPLLWAVAAFVALTACLGRIWAGAHWPSDVLGGALFSLAWAAFVLWLPERWLPSPSLRWVRFRRARSP